MSFWVTAWNTASSIKHKRDKIQALFLANNAIQRN
jgi:hypothetical protein